jgi:hypothetical protein
MPRAPTLFTRRDTLGRPATTKKEIPMSPVRITAVIVSALFAGAAYAQTSTQPSDDKAPMTQGAESVEKNLETKPDNKGLKNASARIKRNQERMEDRRDRRAERRGERMERGERPERGERGERPEHVERAERSGR